MKVHVHGWIRIPKGIRAPATVMGEVEIQTLPSKQFPDRARTSAFVHGVKVAPMVGVTNMKRGNDATECRDSRGRPGRRGDGK